MQFIKEKQKIKNADKKSTLFKEQYIEYYFREQDISLSSS